MQYKLKIDILLFLLFLSVSCQNSSNQLTILYMGEDSTAQYPISCEAFESEFEPHYIDTLITDEAILGKIDKEISSLEQIESNEKVEDQDIRIKLVRNYTSGNKDTLCLGSFFGTVLNGELMKDNKELLQTVKQIIYNKEGK